MTETHLGREGGVMGQAVVSSRGSSRVVGTVVVVDFFNYISSAIVFKKAF
jgi:hypothetical protein